jgi:hypothetical protein
MENMDKKNCDMCGHDGSKHYLLRVFLKLIIIALIFMFGFCLGQMTGYIKAQYGGYEYGSSMMGRNNYGRGMMNGYGYNNGYYGQVVPPTTITPVPVR